MKKYLNWHKIHSTTAFEIGWIKASFSFIVILFQISATIKEKTTEKLKALMSFAISRKHMKFLKKSKSLRMFGKKEKLYLKAWWENNKVWRLAFWLAGPFWRCTLQPRVSKRLRAFEKDADTKKNRHNHLPPRNPNSEGKNLINSVNSHKFIYKCKEYEVWAV